MDNFSTYQQDLAYNPNSLELSIKGTKKGRGHIDNGKLVNESKDFSQKNYSPLDELQSALKRIIFPEIYKESQRFNLTEEDYHFLYKYLSMLPGESKHPTYDNNKYYDSYVKFFMFGDSKKPMPTQVRIFNKVGDAYGYLTDNAYIVDFDNNIEFFLSAVIYVNENQIFNDDNYEYDKIGLPFMANLGKVFYEYELERSREITPDLSKFRVDYSK